MIRMLLLLLLLAPKSPFVFASAAKAPAAGEGKENSQGRAVVPTLGGGFIERSSAAKSDERIPRRRRKAKREYE